MSGHRDKPVLTLPADVTRCLGGNCPISDQCRRYTSRDEAHPNLSYIQTGAFVDGKCLYQLPPETKATHL